MKSAFDFVPWWNRRMLMCTWGLWVFIFWFLKEEILLRDQGTLQKYSALEIFRLNKIMVTGVDLLNFPSRPFFFKQSEESKRCRGAWWIHWLCDVRKGGENLQGLKEASYIWSKNRTNIFQRVLFEPWGMVYRDPNIHSTPHWKIQGENCLFVWTPPIVWTLRFGGKKSHFMLETWLGLRMSFFSSQWNWLEEWILWVLEQ